MKKSIKNWSWLLIFVLLGYNVFAKDYWVVSPNGKIKTTVSIDNGLIWSASVDGQSVFTNNKIGLILNGVNFEESIRLKNVKESSVSQTVETVVAVKSKKIKNEYNQLILNFRNDFALVFRVFDNGFAYRFESLRKSESIITDEQIELNFTEDNLILFPEEESMVSHFERLYIDEQLSKIEADRFCSLPTLVKTSNNIKIGITEADLHNYPCLFLEGTGSVRLKSKFPKSILDFEYRDPQGMKSIKEASYIAKVEAGGTLPWRVFMISREDRELIENQMVYLLSDKCKLEDTSWIKPGLVAWEWWNHTNLYGVDFKTGINNDTYKYYIDFASKYNIPYVLMDAGWSKSSINLLESRPEINVPELVAYGKERNVGLILWAYWNAIDRDMEKIFTQWEKWGVKGLKVDFLRYANDYMVDFYERTAKACAKHKLLVDFHGAFKPTGLHRAYPNIMNYEGVKGLENCKWDTIITPQHDVTIPFTRMLAGPMDYTPGAMRNALSGDFKISNSNPMSMGTRCHQLAMYIVYDAPWQMLADSPSNYYKEEESIRFLSQMKTTWDETKVLDGKVGDYIVTARRTGSDWYVGAMTDQNSRMLDINLSFLGDGDYEAEMMQDGINADKIAIDYKRTLKNVNSSSKIIIQMSSGGGWAAIFKKK